MTNEWRYEVDGEHRFRTQAELAAYLHAGKMQLTKFISKGVEEFNCVMIRFASTTTSLWPVNKKHKLANHKHCNLRVVVFFVLVVCVVAIA